MFGALMFNRSKDDLVTQVTYTGLKCRYRKCLNWRPERLCNFLRREAGANSKGAPV